MPVNRDTDQQTLTRACMSVEPQMLLVLFVGCLTSQQHASVSQGRICSDNLTCCHTEIEAADQTFFLTQSLYIDTRPTSPCADPILLGAWQGSHWSANFEVPGMTRPGKIPSQAGIEARIFRSRGRRLNHKASEAAEFQINRCRSVKIQTNRHRSINVGQ